MLIAVVVGEVVTTQKHDSHVARKALLVQPLHLDGSKRGDPVVALDSVDAGVGDRVLLVTEGYSAMTSVGRPESPIDMAVIGVIDRVDLFDVGLGSPATPGLGGTLPPLERLPAGGSEALGPGHAVKKKSARKQ
jgi:ethanolamine utilization protein EutN